MKKSLAVLCLAMCLSACGSTPTAPTPAPIAPANIVNEGGILNVSGCQIVSVTGLFNCNGFNGLLRNTGAGCAANIRGTLTIVNSGTGAQIATAGWTYGPAVRSTEQFAFTGGPVSTTQVGTWAYTTTAAWDSVRCP